MQSGSVSADINNEIVADNFTINEDWTDHCPKTQYVCCKGDLVQFKTDMVGTGVILHKPFLLLVGHLSRLMTKPTKWYMRGARWLSGRVSDFGARGRGSKPTAAVLCPWARHFTPRKYWLITQEAVAQSRHDWKIVDWDVKPQHKHKNDICTQRRLRSAWASAQSDQSSLAAWRNLGSLATHWAHSEDWSDWADAQADLSLLRAQWEAAYLRCTRDDQ